VPHPLQAQPLGWAVEVRGPPRRSRGGGAGGFTPLLGTPATKNRHFCTRNGIRLSGKRLGRPPKDPEVNAANKRQLSADQRRRNEVEGCFGSGKRKYSLGLIMARLKKDAETSISMAFLVICAEKILRLLRLFFVLILSWFCQWCWSRTLRMAFRNICLLETSNGRSLLSRVSVLPTPSSLAPPRSTRHFFFRSPQIESSAKKW
jgi:hypothetical protein